MSRKSLLVLFLVAVWLVACSSPTPAQEPSSAAQLDLTATPHSEIASNPQRVPTPHAPPEMVTKVAADNATFAWQLYHAVRDTPGNLFFSPHSISTTLAMTYAGARGETEVQMAATLHYSLPQNDLHPALNALDFQMNQPVQGSNHDGFSLTVANGLWGQTGYMFRQPFLDLLAEHHGAGLRQVDFTSEATREHARQDINAWVGQQTSGAIQELIDKRILSQDTRLVLANAIYFKGLWETPFLNGTKEQAFTLLDKRSVQVSMMARRASTAMATGKDYQAVELPYKGQRMHMTIIVPEPGQFNAVEQRLDRAFVDELVQNLRHTDLKLYLPKFKYDADLSLKPTLGAMGMPLAFDPKRADFSGMDGTRKLFLSHVVHKAVVSVDEQGTEAAAATGVVAEIESLPTTITIDRPFLFLIRDAESGAVVFIGRVVNPQV